MRTPRSVPPRGPLRAAAALLAVAAPTAARAQQEPPPPPVSAAAAADTSMAGHAASQGMLGNWRMNREASGTSWLPDSSPLYGKMGRLGSFQTMVQGQLYGVGTDQGGPRGDADFYVPSRLMGMAWDWQPDGTLWGFRGMVSADAALMGTRGYPLLFQTGETAFGRPLTDRQHPHDVLMELAATWARPLNRGRYTPFVYLGIVGEPALGPTAYPHRPSAFDNPEAPLGHHWFDSTHVSHGVATAGLAAGGAAKVEASVFTGREPDENRWRIDRFRFDSYSGRLSVNPSRDVSAQVSHAFLKEPEALEPNTNQQRTTASISYNAPRRGGRDNWQTMLAWGRNRKFAPNGVRWQSDAWLLESAYLGSSYTVFGRIESTDKDELELPFLVFPTTRHFGPGGIPLADHTPFNVDKFTLGGVKNVYRVRGAELGVGGSVSVYDYPGVLELTYGSPPVSFTLFFRLRTERM
ncbi:MAG TPA: hypothetical protein VM490_26265 [Armatimonadaceae bacterium]|nr:hypothetical protein [Armatimonadaceae bacterium]